MAIDFDHVVVDGHKLCASWSLREGHRACFAGPSKCGKSLQLKILAGEAPLLPT